MLSNFKKVQWLIVSCALGVFSLQGVGDFTCPETDIQQTHCAGPKDCLYPNPDDCHSYIRCEVNEDGMTGRPTVYQCPAGMEWNRNTAECDWPGQPGTCSEEMSSR